MSEWIKVSDRLPERSTPVLVYVPSIKKFQIGTIPIYVASLCDWKDMCNDWHFLPQEYEPNDVAFEDVTHWMELPEVPHE
jgi:hypothetical protein